MTRLACANALSKTQAFPGLTPLFENRKGAVRYSIDLGRSMATKDPAAEGVAV